ncbi:hypothetical protein ONZ51_g11285 [Trametes cubensis]|uniref:Uncharacterized protein n=1 Tax=Trametes cubensis TaxID=1111947 RepID=A0AAD7THY7_9APHY|nr:hypothetical protein ONZ51_g11285 [Trametes cubensis]
MDIVFSNTFTKDWTDIVKRYERILDEADRAATQIVAVLKLLYVVRERKTATLGQIVEELTELRTQLEPRLYDVKSTAVVLKGDVEAFYQRVQKVPDDRSADTTCSSKNYHADSKPHVYEFVFDSPPPPPPPPPETPTSTHRVHWICTKLLKILDFLLSRLCIRITRRKGVKDKTQDGSEATVDVQEAPNPSTDSATPLSSSKISDDTSNNRREPSYKDIAETETVILLESLKEVLAGIEKQTSKLDAFPQLAQRLQSTIDAYVTVINGFGKDEPQQTLREARPRSGELARNLNDWESVPAHEVSSFGSAFAISEQ